MHKAPFSSSRVIQRLLISSSPHSPHFELSRVVIKSLISPFWSMVTSVRCPHAATTSNINDCALLVAPLQSLRKFSLGLQAHPISFQMSDMLQLVVMTH